MEMLDDVQDKHLFRINKIEGGHFRIEECCDWYFSEVYTKEQIIQLGNEIIALASE